MTKPISAGCLAEVINGLTGASSPNIGLIVKVIMYVGDEKTLGRIWCCEAEYGTKVQERAHVPGNQMDCAQSWLRRLPDDPVAPKAQEIKSPEEETAEL